MQRIVFPLLLLLSSCAVLAQPTTGQLDSLLSTVAAEEGFNGNVLLAQNGELVYQGSFGYVDLDAKQPLDAGTSFRLASLSKQFTALGIALLENDGKLSFDDPLSEHIPELNH